MKRTAHTLLEEIVEEKCATCNGYGELFFVVLKEKKNQHLLKNCTIHVVNQEIRIFNTVTKRSAKIHLYKINCLTCKGKKTILIKRYKKKREQEKRNNFLFVHVYSLNEII